MKSIGIVRKMDELGRIVLPKELRTTMDLREGDSLEIFVDADTISLKKYQPACIFCGSAEDMQPYQGRNICGACRRAIAEQK